MRTQCCIAGGGPAGMMAGFLLARAGVDVVVLEKHADFLRDFRGDTIHPSTLEIMHELGLLEAFLRLPHREVHKVTAQVGDDVIHIAELDHVPTHCKFLVLMPQWDFLDFIAREARKLPRFHLVMQAAATDLLTGEVASADVPVSAEGGDLLRVRGVRAHTAARGLVDIEADLVIAADGRSSILRERAGLAVNDLGAPMDVLWFRVERHPSHDPSDVFGRVAGGNVLVMLDRGAFWQAAFVIPKGGLDALEAGGIHRLHERLHALAPWLGQRIETLRSFDDVNLLTVKVDRLERWYQHGFLCIGDAAHAMSPIGGVGVNLAVQDAVAAARMLAGPLLHERLDVVDLARVQRRREFPTRVTQWAQVQIQNRLIRPVLAGDHFDTPLVARLFERVPSLRRLPARFIGVGVRPEHVVA